MKLVDLAAGLSLSPSAVSRLVARGMPTDSIGAAQAWRLEHVRPRFTLPRESGPTRSESKRMLDRVTRLAAQAADALERGAFDLIEPDLRAAIRSLPGCLRGRVLIELPEGESFDRTRADERTPEGPYAVIPASVMDALIADLMSVLQPDAGEVDNQDAEWAGDLLVSVAAGEWRLAD